MRKIILPITLFIMATLCAVFLIKEKVFAGQYQVITISPPQVAVTLSPGEKKEGIITLISDSDQSLNFSTAVFDFIVQDTHGTVEILPRGTITSNRYSGANWIALYPQTFTLIPRQRYELHYFIQVPPDVAPGGHYAALVYQPESQQVQNGSGAQVKTQIATLVYITVSGPVNQNARIEGFTAPKLSEYGPVPVSTVIDNLGDIHINPIGTITVTDMFGQTRDKVMLDQRNIFPGNVALDYINKVGTKWMFGRFKAELTATYGEKNDLPLNAIVYFWVIPWKVIIIVILVIIILVLLGAILIKQKKQSTLSVKQENSRKLSEEKSTEEKPSSPEK